MSRCSGLLPLIATACLASTSSAAITQWRVEDGGNGHYYDIVVTPKQSWYAMRDQAFALGGYLASIRSAEENSWIWTTFSIATTEAYWANYFDGPVFGGFRLDYANPWTWVSGEEWGYSNFGWSSNDGPHGTQFIAHSPSWDDLPALGGSAGGNVAMVVEWEYNPVPAPAAAPLLALAGLLTRSRRRA